LYKVLGFLAGIAFIIILLFTSIQAVVYWTPNYFRHEYSKYKVDEEVGVSLDDLETVTNQMLSYLDGSRDNLSDIKTTIRGVKDTNFFNEREVAHMVDVRELFLNALFLRTVLIIFIVIAAIFIYFTKGNVIQVFKKGFLLSTIAFFMCFVILAILIFRDFESAFITFHHIFFNNDLWILDPATDNLINIVPVGFFFDTARNISIVFVGNLIVVSILCLVKKRDTKEIKG